MATDDGVRSHYERLADRYDEVWVHSPEFLDWMTRQLARRLSLHGGDWLLDVGAGTGIYARQLTTRVPDLAGVVCLDPSASMLEQVAGADIHTFEGDELAAREALASVGLDRASGVLVKEAVHHFEDMQRGIRQLCELLAPGGRIVVAMLPPTLQYPLFQGALDLYESRQPHHDDVAAAMRAAGVSAQVGLEDFELEFSFVRYAEMVRARYMSLLSAFDDDEIEAGIDEMTERYGKDQLRFVDRFAFVVGSAPVA